jgi:hypothetical protein
VALVTSEASYLKRVAQRHKLETGFTRNRLSLLVFTANFSDAKQTDRVQTGQTTCKSVKPVENLQNCKKVATSAMGKNPNGKSRIQYVLACFDGVKAIIN